MASEDTTPADQQVEEILLYLHNYSFYSQKVLLYLNEKGIKYRTQFVNIAAGEQYTPAFLKINPKGEVPVIKDKDEIIVDSAKIISHLEEKTSVNKNMPRLIPTDGEPEMLARHNHFHELIHDLPADVITMGSFFHQQLVRRPKVPFLLPTRIHMRNITERLPAKLRKLAEEEPDFAEPLKAKAEKIEEDLKVMRDTEAYQKVLERVEAVLAEVEAELVKQEGKGWLLGERFTLADVALTTLLERLNVLGLETRMWGSRPQVAAYFARVRQRDCYRKSTPSLLFHAKTFLKAVTYLQLF